MRQFLESNEVVIRTLFRIVAIVLLVMTYFMAREAESTADEARRHAVGAERAAESTAYKLRQ